MLENAAAAGIPVYVAIAPINPFHDASVLAEVVSRTAHLPLREIFCEVLNPEGSNMERMQKALSEKYPGFAEQLADYRGQRWVKFTYDILEYGHRTVRRFVPWPDSGKKWRAHLPDSKAAFLDRFIPVGDS